MTLGGLFALVQMSRLAAGVEVIFHDESLERLIQLEDVVLEPGLDAEDVAVFDVILFAVEPDLGLAVDDHPIFVAVVVMAIEMPAVHRFERAGAGDAAPLRAILRGHIVNGCIDARLVRWPG